jgi:hypothetical protein
MGRVSSTFSMTWLPSSSRTGFPSSSLVALPWRTASRAMHWDFSPFFTRQSRVFASRSVIQRGSSKP